MRKHYFNDAETGFFKKVKRKVVPKNPMTGELLVLYSTISILINVTSLTLIDCSSRWLYLIYFPRFRPQYGDRHDEGEPDERAPNDFDWWMDQLGLLWLRHKYW